MAQLSEATQRLIAKYNLWQQSQKPKEGVSTIHVDEVVSRVAAFYEYIRTIVDWKEEHLMRRSAIIRKLKRRFLNLELNNFSEKEEIAEPLILELIRGGHFPNDNIEESKIADVKKVIDKYIFILKNSIENKKGRAGLQFYNWLLEIAACEIEETLATYTKETALIDYMFDLMKERIRVGEDVFKRKLLKEEEKDIQIYIAVQQSLFKFDKPIISYNLIKYKYPQWKNTDEDLILKISQNIHKIWKRIEKDLLHPLNKKFYAICEKYDTPYLLLGDILSQKSAIETGREIQKPPVLEQLLRSSYSKRLSTLKARLSRAAVYSTISIFITKVLSLLILEIILFKVFEENFNIIILATDVLLPTILMFILVATIKLPSDKNLSLVIVETMKIVYQNEKTDIYDIKILKKRGVITRMIISFVYLLGACVSFGFIFWIFYLFKFSTTSIIINFIFIALIIFAGMAIRKRAEELTVENDYDGFLSFLSDILFLPVAGVGRWLSNKWKRYNAVSAFFNALIDMPFSVFVEFLERWRYFIKERKEEIR
ncbi:MAG: hypothetical protein HY005_00340 [Candidatus Staskawiczbacteria bacterium]|nr:hypothetical protein [Candidatus Staskawiczbacteria bacterium]MBI3337059.1 hypothetical protein [Candidatus Staskawiczbacteria bacterium]